MSAPPSQADRPWQVASTVKSHHLLYWALGEIIWITVCKELRTVPDILWVLCYSLMYLLPWYWEWKVSRLLYILMYLLFIDVKRLSLSHTELFVLNSLWANVNIIIVLSFCLCLSGLSLGICIFSTFLLLCSIIHVRYISCKQHIVGACFYF